MGWLTRNWHLKLAALGLATILYTGFVYSGSFTDQLFPGLPVEAINQPSGAYPLTQQLGTVVDFLNQFVYALPKAIPLEFTQVYMWAIPCNQDSRSPANCLGP